MLLISIRFGTCEVRRLNRALILDENKSIFDGIHRNLSLGLNNVKSCPLISFAYYSSLYVLIIKATCLTFDK